MENENGIIQDVDAVNTQIAYLWIEKYIKLENQGINFGCPYIFNFDQASKVLAISKNERFIPGFFAKDDSNVKISNVSAIAGKNGSGKSSILRFILDQLLDNAGGVKDNCIIAILLNDKLKIYTNLPYKIEIPPTADIPMPVQIDISPETKPLETAGKIEFSRYYQVNAFYSIHADFVYVNPAFELKPQIDANINRCDLSTNHFLEIDFGRLSSVNNINRREDEDFDALINKHNELIDNLTTEKDIDSQKTALMASLKRVHHSFDYFRSQRLERHAFSEIERIVKLISDHYKNPKLMNLIRDHATIPEILTIKLQRNWVQDFKSNISTPPKKTDSTIDLLQAIGTRIYIKYFADTENIQWQKRLTIETLMMLIYIESRNSINKLYPIERFEQEIESIESLDKLIERLTEAYAGFLWRKPYLLQENFKSYFSSIDKLESL